MIYNSSHSSGFVKHRMGSVIGETLGVEKKKEKEANKNSQIDKHTNNNAPFHTNKTLYIRNERT